MEITAMRFDIKKSNKIALILYFSGFRYQCSSFEDIITYGYGKLDQWGFWQFELIEKK